MSRNLNTTDPEDALWVSCPECDALPGDFCILNPALADKPGFDKAVHQARIRSMCSLVELEHEAA